MLIGALIIGLSFTIVRSNNESLTTTMSKNFVIPSFWKNTGLCPASEPTLRISFLLSHDEKLNFDYIGALPNKAIQMIRIHWLLDLITLREIRSNKPIFTFEHLDLLIDRLFRKGLYPSFELMGNPSNFFRDINTQANEWTGLIKQIIKRYSSLYGAEYIQFWKFELMNEPDLKQYNFLNFTLKNYIKYFRASENAVPEIAGPAGLFRSRKTHLLCWGLLDYCNSNPCNLNMITFHRKGGEVGSQVVDEGLKLILSIISEYPKLKNLSFGNSEADIMTGWSKPLEWRADVRYAALVVQVILGHIEEILLKRNIQFKMLSNDNAFLSFSPNYFTQRTLLARFQMNNTAPPHVQFFRKPVYSVMALLSLLGRNLVYISYQPGEKGYSYIISNDTLRQTYLGVITNDRMLNETYVSMTFTKLHVKMDLRNSPLSGISVGYLMNNVNNNPYQVWKDAGSPDFPDAALRRNMRKAEGFGRLFVKYIEPYDSLIEYVKEEILVPSILIINVCFKGIQTPGPVTDLHYENITDNEILLMWKDTLVDNKCLLTYVVEFKGLEDTEFFRINNEDSIFLSYHFDGSKPNGSQVKVDGEYRVAAVDYWNRRGLFSDILTVKT